jgi:hypothetical protein
MEPSIARSPAPIELSAKTGNRFSGRLSTEESFQQSAEQTTHRVDQGGGLR